MPTFLQNLFRSLADPGQMAEVLEHDLQLATAALLIEMKRADGKLATAEDVALRAALRQEFGLDRLALDALIEEAEAEARDAPGYYAFTHRINDGFSQAQKLRVMEYLWRIALADGHLAAHENHLMRKLADLIHIGHGDYHAAKARARAYLDAQSAAH
ncbi:TerB family tellurite resistance protein [Nitrogeniibacter mangrovi]|uniref:TerB family tellurite resistance protein n=1 Tax=Nitrogeniibacter mangrovi TaxID=2016596 RepID=A0A6C1B6W3_9RHOO|nr:TerB family tellurite resistance protein [Nitrogeniibacter mangrovi]QID17994.1 TerB family tellurite resistance protein [Nitrogeniibacter mangrovi]